MASSSAAAALSLYEKYTQLNHQLDETRETRSSLQKQVQDTQERLDEYETLHKPALRQSTQNLHDETEHWQEQLSSAQEEGLPPRLLIAPHLPPRSKDDAHKK